jgi:hypothetical protein
MASQCAEENKTTIAEKGERRKNPLIQNAALLKQFSPRTLGMPTAGDGVAICIIPTARSRLSPAVSRTYRVAERHFQNSSTAPAPRLSPDNPSAKTEYP